MKAAAAEGNSGAATGVGVGAAGATFWITGAASFAGVTDVADVAGETVVVATGVILFFSSRLAGRSVARQESLSTAPPLEDKVDDLLLFCIFGVAEADDVPDADPDADAEVTDAEADDVESAPTSSSATSAKNPSHDADLTFLDAFPAPLFRPTLPTRGLAPETARSPKPEATPPLRRRPSLVAFVDAVGSCPGPNS